MTRLTWLAGCAVVVATQGVMSSPAAGADSAAPGGATVIEQVTPVGPGGFLAPGYKVTHTLGGATCKSHSPVTGNAYSCHVRFGYDPCWVTNNKPYVVCLTSPYYRRVTKLRVAVFVNRDGLGSPAAYPWGLQLSNGTRTTLIPGNFGTVGKYQIHYSYNEFRTVLVGPIDKSGPVWRIRQAKNTGRFRFKVTGWATITKAWFGAATTIERNN